MPVGYPGGEAQEDTSSRKLGRQAEAPGRSWDCRDQKCIMRTDRPVESTTQVEWRTPHSNDNMHQRVKTHPREL